MKAVSTHVFCHFPLHRYWPWHPVMLWSWHGVAGLDPGGDHSEWVEKVVRAPLTCL